jgi:3-deoxy-D-manno-octulosonate 8-phosphate phosphatase (KDO 8-P phosphatase)
MLGRAAIDTAILTGRKSKVVEFRARELGIKEVYQKIFVKSEIYEKLLVKYKCDDENVAFMGDDVVDQELFKRAGLTAAPADAEESAKKWADIVSSRKGGRGAVREFVDIILKATGKWEKVSGESLG